MKLSNKQKKALFANLMDIFEHEQATAVQIPDHEGKILYVMLRPDIFSDMKTENDQMKFWLDTVVRKVFELQDDNGEVIMKDLAEKVRHLNLLAVDGISRFMGMDAKAIEEAQVE